MGLLTAQLRGVFGWWVAFVVAWREPGPWAASRDPTPRTSPGPGLSVEEGAQGGAKMPRRHVRSEHQGAQGFWSLLAASFRGLSPSRNSVSHVRPGPAPCSGVT